VKHSTGRPTKAEQARLDAIHDMPCCACVIEGIDQPNPTEAQHLVDKGYRKHSGGHMATIPLCGWHHRAEPLMELTRREMGIIYGPSLASSKRAFVAMYGTERELLAITDEALTKRNAA
jgi:hypothetical protein